MAACAEAVAAPLRADLVRKRIDGRTKRPRALMCKGPPPHRPKSSSRAVASGHLLGF